MFMVTAVVATWIGGRLELVTFCHVVFDELRDSMVMTTGFSWIAENRQMLLLTALGQWLFWRLDWYRFGGHGAIDAEL